MIFQSTLPVWGATRQQTHIKFLDSISIHAPRVGSDLIHIRPEHKRYDFNPRSPCGERPGSWASCWAASAFQSTLPVWGATPYINKYREIKIFQSTLPVWGATVAFGTSDDVGKFQSTLPVWGATRQHMPRKRKEKIFQSTLPVWGATSMNKAKIIADYVFQSTLPVWGATWAEALQVRKVQFQSTLPVWGATSSRSLTLSLYYDFNPRSPCGERRRRPRPHRSGAPDFNPRSPCGERPRRWVSYVSVLFVISIHAPRVGSDSCYQQQRRQDHQTDFNPRSPCGERRPSLSSSASRQAFQSTLPVWGATVEDKPAVRPDTEFQSTLPVWGATKAGAIPPFLFEISIHAPRVGSDVRVISPDPVTSIISIHAPRVGSDHGTLQYPFP